MIDSIFSFNAASWMNTARNHTLLRIDTPLLIMLLIFISNTSTSILAQDKKEAADDATTAISYYEQVRPIFQANCHGCHQPAKRGGDYEMTSFDHLLSAGETGEAAIVPGQPEKSYLLEQIRVKDGSAEMPKSQKPLAQSDYELIENWIKAGAIDDSPANTVTTFDMEHPPVYQVPPVITSVDFSPDGKYLAVSAYHEVVIYTADASAIVARLVGLSERIEANVFSPDSKQIAIAGGSPGRRGEIQIWEIESKKLLLSRTEGFDTLYGASWSTDGKYVAFGCPDKSVRAIDALTGEQVLFNGAHNDWVFDTVFAVKNDHIVSVSRDRSMKLFKFDTQRFIDNITSITPGALKGGLSAVDRHPTKDEVLAGGADGVPKLYKMYREQDRKIGDDFNLIRPYAAMAGRIYDVRFNADGSQLVACSSQDSLGQIRVYQTDDAKQLLNIDVAEGGQYSVDFSADGQRIVAGGFDGQVRIYETSSGKLLKAFPPVPLEPTTAQK